MLIARLAGGEAERGDIDRLLLGHCGRKHRNALAAADNLDALARDPIDDLAEARLGVGS